MPKSLTVGRYALDGHPFTIRFFIGKVPDGGYAEVSQALTQVGEIYNFCDPVEFDKPNCENCAKQARAHLKITGQVPLTNPLLTRFKQQIPHETDSGEKTILEGMEPEQVVRFLRDHFHWRVTDVSFPPCPATDSPVISLTTLTCLPLFPHITRVLTVCRTRVT